MELSFALDQHLVLSDRLENGFNLKLIGLYWHDGDTVHFPEKFSMLNVFRRHDNRNLTQKKILLER